MPFGDNVGPNREIKVVSLIPVFILGIHLNKFCLRDLRLEKFKRVRRRKEEKLSVNNNISSFEVKY